MGNRASSLENMVETLASWKEARVLVTGAAGLVGSWLVRSLLEANATVIALVHHPDSQTNLYRSGDYKSVSIVQGELEDYALLERTINKYEIDTVFHLGAQALVNVAYRSPLQTFETNIRGTYNLLEACRQHSSLVKRIVIASSDKAYGTKTELPYTEDMSLEGVFPYEVSKTCTDLISRSYFHTYKLPLAIARCGNIYGGGDLNWSRIVPDTIRSCIQRTSLNIRSDGTFIRDYIYVKDVVNAYMCTAEHLHDEQVRGQAFNFSPQEALSVLKLVQAIRQLMNCTDVELNVMNTAKGEIHSQYLDSTKAKTIMGWEPKYSLEAGLSETIAWYKDYFSVRSSIELNRE